MPSSSRTFPIPNVNVYIDGHNFYRPIEQQAEQSCDAAVLKLAWCNYCKLADQLARRAFGVPRAASVKLFTAFARDEVRGMLHGGAMPRRKNLWLEALRLASDSRLHISSGRWEPQGCEGRMEDKLTDVKLSISLVRDAFSPPRLSPAVTPQAPDRERMFSDDDPAAPFDHAIVISADKDFLPAAELAARERNKNVAIFFPYQSQGYRKPVGSRVFFGEVLEDDLRKCHLPDEIAMPGSGVTAVRWADYLASRRWSSKRPSGSLSNYSDTEAEAAVAR